MATLAEIRAKLKAQDTRTSTGFVGDNAKIGRAHV